MKSSSHNQNPGKADLEWSDGQPVSRRFDDVYFSRENGLAEAHHVFIEGNRLPERWQSLNPGAAFHIFETGFGTGLNFLCAVGLWLELSPEAATLHYVSVEKFPLSSEELARALEPWSAITDDARELLQSYPPTFHGVHRLWLFNNRVCLTLVFDDALTSLTDLLHSDHPQFRHLGPALADAWFLDGFAPAKNPDMWSVELFERIACFCHGESTLATFTVARLVREGLATAGFDLEKNPGFGRKREMLRGHYRGEKPPSPHPGLYQPPRALRNSKFESPWYLSSGSRPAGKTVAIIGAGIAGCSTAAALVRRGFSVTVYDRHGVPGMEASGNPQGILYPRLSPEDSPLALFARHALCFSLDFYESYWQSGNPGARCGVLVLPESDKERASLEQICRRFTSQSEFVQCLNGDEISQAAGITLSARLAVFFPRMGWLSPREMCTSLLTGTQVIAADVDSLHREGETGQWQLICANGNEIARADQVVIANSFHARQFSQCASLPLRSVRGQISIVPANPDSSGLQAVICGAGYLAPAWEGFHTLGATYDMDDARADIRLHDHRRNLAAMAATDIALGNLFNDKATSPESLMGRAAVRCTTPDYLPVAGAVADEQAMRARFCDLGRNAKADIPLPGCYHSRLWINVGHGSRGFTYAPMAAEMLAAQINGEILPLPRPLAMALSPARFIIRQLKRNRHKAQ